MFCLVFSSLTMAVLLFRKKPTLTPWQIHLKLIAPSKPLLLTVRSTVHFEALLWLLNNQDRRTKLLVPRKLITTSNDDKLNLNINYI